MTNRYFAAALLILLIMGSAAAQPTPEDAALAVTPVGEQTTTIPPAPPPLITVRSIQPIALVSDGDGTLVAGSDVALDPTPPPPPIPAQCSAAEIAISRAYGEAKRPDGSSAGYGYLATRCTAYADYRARGSGDFVTWLANNGYESPAARCYYPRVFRVVWTAGGKPCDCEALDDEGPDKPAKRRLSDPDHRPCPSSCNDTTGLTKVLPSDSWTSLYKVWDDRDPAVVSIVTAKGLNGKDFIGHGVFADILVLGCRSNIDAHLVIAPYVGDE